MQNFRTRSVDVHQAMYEKIQSFPTFPLEAFGRRDLEDRIHIVDFKLADGREFKGVLVFRGDQLLVPESAASFVSEDIIEICPSPASSIPDFTVTDPDILYRGGSIEWGNSWRLSLFGPPDDDEPDWRSVPVAEAHAEALKLNERVDTYDELPTLLHGPSDPKLVPGGIQIRIYPISTEQSQTVVVRPNSVKLWRELLEYTFEIDPNYTLADLARLLDVEEPLADALYHRLGLMGDVGILQRVRAILDPDFAPDQEIQELEVRWFSEEDEGVYDLSLHLTAWSHPLTEDDPSGYPLAGERINYGADSFCPAHLRHAPLRYSPEIEFPVSHEEIMGFYRGPMREWRRGGEEGPKPEMPFAFRTKHTIRLREFIGAVLNNLCSENWGDED